MNNLKPNKQRAAAAITLIWVVLGAEMLSFMSNCWRYNLLMNEFPAERMNEAILNDSIQSLLVFIYFIAFIISTFTFIQWFRRAYYNLHTKVGSLSYSEGWAAGSWFIPIICLYMPYLIMKELYVQTDKLLSEKLNNYSKIKSFSFIGIWWGLWITANILQQLSSVWSDELLNQMKIITALDIINTIIYIPLALFTIKVIKEYSKLEYLLSLINEKKVPRKYSSADSY